MSPVFLWESWNPLLELWVASDVFRSHRVLDTALYCTCHFTITAQTRPRATQTSSVNTKKHRRAPQIRHTRALKLNWTGGRCGEWWRDWRQFLAIENEGRGGDLVIVVFVFGIAIHIQPGSGGGMRRSVVGERITIHTTTVYEVAVVYTSTKFLPAPLPLFSETPASLNLFV